MALHNSESRRRFSSFGHSITDMAAFDMSCMFEAGRAPSLEADDKIKAAQSTGWPGNEVPCALGVVLSRRLSNQKGLDLETAFTNSGNLARLLKTESSVLFSTTMVASWTIWQGFASAQMASSAWLMFSFCRKQWKDCGSQSSGPSWLSQVQDDVRTFKAFWFGLVTR